MEKTLLVNIDSLPPSISTGYISSGLTGINGNTGYYKGTISLRADVNDSGI